MYPLKRIEYNSIKKKIIGIKVLPHDIQEVGLKKEDFDASHMPKMLKEHNNS